MRKIIKNILELFKDKGYEDVIITKEANKIDSVNSLTENDGFDFNLIEDARSATFFSLGRINVSRKPAIIIMNNKELENSLTGVTETNYQNLPLIILSVSKEKSKLNKECFKNVTKQIINFKSDSKVMLEEIETYLDSKWYKPLLIEIIDENIVENVIYEEEYKNISEKVLELCKENSNIYLDENSIKNNYIEIENNKKLKIFNNSNSYGVISRVLGHSVVNDNSHYLITSYDKVTRDINSLNMRGINNNIIIIYVKPREAELNLESWITYNKFEFFSIGELEKIKEILENKNNNPIIIEYLIEKGGI